MTNSQSNLQDLQKSYDSITKSFLIPPSDDLYTTKNIILRQMIVNLEELYWNLENKNKNWETIEIYTDILVIPSSEDTSFVIRGKSVKIFARQIEVIGDSNAVIVCYQKNAQPLVLYADEIIGTLSFSYAFVNKAKSQQIDIIIPTGSLGVQVQYDDKISLSNLSSIPATMMNSNSDLYWYSVTGFNVATTLYEDQPEIANDITKWLTKITSKWTGMQEMFLQSSALLCNLQKSLSQGKPYVPYIDPKIYEKLGESFTKSVKDFEQEYDKLCDANARIEDQKSAANLMLSHYNDIQNFNQSLIEQCHTNLKNTQKGLEQNSKRMSSQQRTIETAKQKFEQGLEEWKTEQEREAAMAIVGAVIGVVAGVGSMFLGNPTGVITATATIGSGASAIEATVKIVDTASQLAKLMEKIAKALEVINKVYEAIQKILEATEKLKSEDNLLNLPEQLDFSSLNSENSLDDTDWDVLQQEFDAFLQYPVSQRIGGAVEYQKELRILVIYGKALNSSKVQVTQLNQQLVRLQLEKGVSDKQVDRIGIYINALSDREKPNKDMMQLFYGMYLNVKRWLFVALQNYNAGYRYWALREPSFKPSILYRASVLQKDLTTVQRDYLNALERFNPAPSTFDNKFCTILDRDVLERFKETKQLIWAISLEEETFEGLDRVRLDVVRVWLDGAIQKDTNGIYISICTDGLYSDRLGSNQYQFVGEPVKRVFQYNPDNGKTTKEKIQVDGNVAKQFEDVYLKPTPFTTWIISLPDKDKFNQKVDLSNMTQIRMEFAGSAIGS